MSRYYNIGKKMRTIRRIILVLCMMLSLAFVVTILTACAVESDAEQDVEVTNPRLYYMSNHDRMAILVDDETGVNYIYYGGYG